MNKLWLFIKFLIPHYAKAHFLVVTDAEDPDYVRLLNVADFNRIEDDRIEGIIYIKFFYCFGFVFNIETIDFVDWEQVRVESAE